jgi:chromosome partitioning protein
MYTVALIAQKGGTGKTTLAVSLAVAAGQVGMTSIIVDLDPQATACNWKDRRKGDGPVVIDAQPARLAAALAKAEENGVDFAVIDTPARNEQSALAAARVADLVLIPCRPQAYDLETIPNTKEILALAGHKPAIAVLNAVPAIGDRHEQARVLLNRLQIPVCPYTLGHRAVFGDAGAVGQAAQEYDPRGKGASEILQVYKYVLSTLVQLKDKPKPKQEHHEQQSKSDRAAG